MRSRNTTSCRSSGLARLGLAAAGLALAGLANSAAGQMGAFTAWPPKKWVAQEELFSHQNAHDEGVDIVYWKEVDGSTTNHWIYVTGWVTEMDGEQVKGTRFATYQYDATFFDSQSGDPPPPEAVAYFPRYDPGQPGHVDIQAGDTYKAVAMIIDETNGDIYITGEGPSSPGASDKDYKVVAYNKDLGHRWASTYDGPVGGDDTPADLALDECLRTVVVVTGTSPGNGTGQDIATVAFATGNGSKATTLWPPNGVRRYNNDPWDGNDRAVAVDGVCVNSNGDDAGLTATVFGTSWGGPTFKEDYTLHHWSGDDPDFAWEYRYETTENDVAVAMANAGYSDQGLIYLTGYSDVPSSSDVDIATVGYLVAWGPEWTDRWDYKGGPDYPTDMHVVKTDCHPFLGCYHWIWITGGGTDGAYSDATTIMYRDGYGETGSLKVEEGYANGYDHHYGKAITAYDGEPYIAGSMSATVGITTSDRMLALAYAEGVLPDYDFSWDTSDAGPYIDEISNEGRGIAVAVVDPGLPEKRSIFIVGVSTVSGEGRQFTTWRYKEE